ncbi:MAG: hypothetical protein JWM53_2344, partial [bacterium]|nr:hypothetical protein [bacterium]
MTTLSVRSSADGFTIPERLGDGGRYRIVSQIGRGGFGTVFRALDTRYCVPVAIKVLHRSEPESIYRFKTEFRGLAEVTHQNLVQLYELSFDRQLWFVVMEHVNGVDLWRHLAGRSSGRATTTTDGDDLSGYPGAALPHVDEEQCRSAFTQLARGVAALHAANKLHRDLKPSNVLVTRDGRVVILDFGLVVELGEDPGALAGRRIGTPGYMSPEQLSGARLTAASDWYAVGAMLWEVLTGMPPRTKQARQAGALQELALRLLDRDPERRPGVQEILASLGGTTPRLSFGVGQRKAATLVGRDEELASLDAAFEQSGTAPVLLRIAGVSGVGKTALIDAWMARHNADVWVLRSRCLERDDVPFKAIDGIIDALTTRVLASSPEVRRDCVPASVAAGARIFPVLAGLDPGARREAASDSEPSTLRDRGFACVRELVTRIAAARRLVLCIDDAQWGDADSARFMVELLQPSTRGVLIIALQRPGVGGDSFPAVLDDWLTHGSDGVVIRDIRLRELGSADSRALAAACLGAAADAGMVERIAKEADGNPFFIRQLAETRPTIGGETDASPVQFAELLVAKLGALSPAARRVIEVVALAARPLSEQVAMHAAMVEGADARAVLQSAQQSRLIAGTGGANDVLFESVHDRIREEVTCLISRDTSRSHHVNIANAMIAAGQREPERLLPHLVGGEDHERASDVALEAAQRAEAVLAFERAAEHYGLVARLGRRPSLQAHLLERRGEMLASAGRCAEAARSLQDAASSLREEALSVAIKSAHALNRRSGELWLRSGYVNEGFACFEGVLRELDLRAPRSEKEAFRTALWLRLKLMLRGRRFRPREPQEIPPETVDRLDTLWGATTSLAMLKPMSADVFQLRHLMGALAAGDSERVIRSLVHEASFESLIGGPLFDRRCRAMIGEMMALSERSPQPYFRAWALQGRGMVAWFHGDWQRAWKDCDAAVKLYTDNCRAVSWELAVCDVYRLSALTYLGRFAELAAIVPEAHRAVRERGDLYATTNLA